MIARQVREHAGGERHPVHAAQRQRVRRHFHRARAAARVDHLAQQRLDVRRFRRRARRLADVVADAVGHRAEQAAPDAGRFEDRRDQIRRRRLAVRAGDADDLHLAARIAVERRGDQRASASRASSTIAHGTRTPSGAPAARRRSRRRRARSPGARTPCRRRAGPCSATNTCPGRHRPRVVRDAGHGTHGRVGAQPIVSADQTVRRGARRAARPRSWRVPPAPRTPAAIVRSTRRQTAAGVERRARGWDPATRRSRRRRRARSARA